MTISKSYYKARDTAIENLDKAKAIAGKAYRETMASAQKTFDEAKELATKRYEDVVGAALLDYEENLRTGMKAEKVEDEQNAKEVQP